MYALTREKVSDVKSTAAAAVLLATKECKCERTIKEINKVVDPTRKMKNSVGKASREMNRVMQERLQVSKISSRAAEIAQLYTSSPPVLTSFGSCTCILLHEGH